MTKNVEIWLTSMGVLSLLIASPTVAGQKFTRSQLLMGNVPVSVTVETDAGKESKAYEAMEKAFDEARRIETEVSEWQPESQTSLLNRSAGKYLVPIGRDLTAILLLAAQVSEITDGAFDITFPSECPRRGRFQTCPYTYRDVIVIPELGLATLRPGVKIAVSGIAKGYIVDRMSAVLRQEGFKKFLVNAGDIYASGRWKIGIRDPNDPRGEKTICTLTVKDHAVSTSGLYERGAHIIDPKTRRPVVPSVKSVTVLTKSSAIADAWATALIILGYEKGLQSLASHPELAVAFVEKEIRTVNKLNCKWN